MLMRMMMMVTTTISSTKVKPAWRLRLPLGIRAPILAMAGRCAADVEDARLGLAGGEFWIFEDGAPFVRARHRAQGQFVEIARVHQFLESARRAAFIADEVLDLHAQGHQVGPQYGLL